MRIFVTMLLVLFCFSSCSDKADSTQRNKLSSHLETNLPKDYIIKESNGEKVKLCPLDSSNNYLIEGSDFSGVVFHEGSTPYGDVFTFRMMLKPAKKDKTNPYTPTFEEVLKAESILKRCMEVDRIGADSLQVWPNAIDELKTYKRQYFGAINSKGQKLIWVNCFKTEPFDHSY